MTSKSLPDVAFQTDCCAWIGQAGTGAKRLASARPALQQIHWVFVLYLSSSPGSIVPPTKSEFEFARQRGRKPNEVACKGVHCGPKFSMSAFARQRGRLQGLWSSMLSQRSKIPKPIQTPLAGAKGGLLGNSRGYQLPRASRDCISPSRGSLDHGSYGTQRD